MKVRALLVAFVVALLALLTTTPAQAATVRARATFASPRTDGLSKVTGSVVIWQTNGGTIRGRGRVSGLPAWSAFVVVPYIGNGCLPVPGVTAFPSSPFVTDAAGVGRPNFTVNPQAINPLGSFTVGQTGSVSIRAVVFPTRTIPGSTLGVPTIPNVAAVEACDEAPVVR